MSHYLLSTWSSDEATPTDPPSPEQMQTFMQRVIDLEAEMDATGTFLFGGGLHGPEVATVVSTAGSEVVVTDGPFAETKEHIAGFYVIDADDLDEAMDWAKKVSEAIGQPIEVRPFRGTGKLADQMAN